MASRSESPEIIETSVILGKRKREQLDKPVLVKLEKELEKVDDNKFDKKTETYGLYGDGDGNDDDDDSDLSSVGMSDAEDDPENLDHEPDQGEILWREADEQFPPCAPYHKDVQAIYSQITDMLDRTVDYLSGISDKSDGLQRLLEQAMETRKFPEPKMPIITLMGDAGAGKSSLISALLDTPHVSREGNFGTSCTCVITEYRKPYPQQTRKFAAKVEFLSSKDRCLLMKDYLKDYVAYHFEKDEDWTYDEEKEFSAQAKTAEGTFLDLFRGRPNFTSREEMKAYIDTAYEDEDEDATAILAQFEEWCKELASDHAPYTGSELIEADRAFELGRLVGPFLSASAFWSDKPSLWPIVRKVSIGVRGPRILEHAILADLPGVSDTNRIRVRASRSYLLTSDYLWIVSPIGRCATDTSVDNLMYEFGDRFKGRLAIICTKTDDPMTFQSFAQEYQEDAKPCKKLEAKTKKAKSEMSAAKAAFKRATNPTTRQERSKAVEDSRAKYERLLHARLNTMVRIRNRKVTTLIMSEKADRLQDGAKDLVYPVSNKHYSWLKGFKDGGNEDAPQLSAEMTGIPKLRAYALSIVSHEIWATFITHIRHKVVSFIMALKAWANATSRGNNSGISDALNKSMKIIENAMTTYHGALEKETMSLLAAPMKEANSNMAKKAYKFLSKEVRIWHWCTIKAFIRRGGKYQSKVVGHQSWNAKMMLPAAKFMSSAWDELIRKEDAANKVFFATIVTALGGTLEDVKEPMELMQIPKEQFQTFLDAQKHGLTSVFTTYKEEFFKQFQNVKYTTEKDDDEGYFAKAMQKIYEEAEGMKGTGYKDAVMSKLEHHVNITSDDSPFMKMANTSASQICRRAVGASEILREDCNKIFKQIFNQFGCMLDNTPDDDGSVAEVKVKLAKFLVDAEKELKKMVERLDQIEQNPFPKGFKKEEEHPIKKLKHEQEASNQVKPEPEPARARRSIKIKAEDAE